MGNNSSNAMPPLPSRAPTKDEPESLDGTEFYLWYDHLGKGLGIPETRTTSFIFRKKQASPPASPQRVATPEPTLNETTTNNPTNSHQPEDGAEFYRWYETLGEDLIARTKSSIFRRSMRVNEPIKVPQTAPSNEKTKSSKETTEESKNPLNNESSALNEESSSNFFLNLNPSGQVAQQWRHLYLSHETISKLEKVQRWLQNPPDDLLERGYLVLLTGKAKDSIESVVKLLSRGPGGDIKIRRINTNKLMHEAGDDVKKLIENLSEIILEAEGNNWILFFDHADHFDHVERRDAFLRRVKKFPGLIFLSINQNSSDFSEEFLGMFDIAVEVSDQLFLQAISGRSGVNLEKIVAIHEKLHQQFNAKGLRFKHLRRLVEIDGATLDRKISPPEFLSKLFEFGLEITEEELNELTALYDRDGDKMISFGEFSRAFRGNLSLENGKLCLSNDNFIAITGSEFLQKYRFSIKSFSKIFSVYLF